MSGADIRLVEREGCDAAFAALRAELTAFNDSHAAAADFTPLALTMRDDAGALIAGLCGDTGWGATGRGWLHVDILWVAEASRGQGLGRRLLRAAEAEAARRGCAHAYLDTLAFQARPFYEREGYAAFGELDGLPPGSRMFFMRKTLAAAE